MNKRATKTTFEELIRIRKNKNKDQLSQEHHINKEEIIAKVVEDIHFLRDRIAHIKRTKKIVSNPTMIHTYQSMLESRESVLTSLCGRSFDSFTEEVRLTGEL